MERPFDAERADQRVHVVGPVAQAVGGLDRQPLGVAETPHVGRQQAIALRRAVEQVLEEAPRGEVAVDEDDRDAVLGTGLDELDPEPIGVDEVRAHGRVSVYAAVSSS